MADKVHKKLATLLPVIVETTTAKKKKEAPPILVQLVSLWALINACLDTFSGPIVRYFNIAPPSWLVPHVGRAADEAARAILDAVMRCVVIQAAAAALALLLPARHRQARRALAYVALAATVASHLMHARVGVALFLDGNGPGSIFFWIICVDLVAFAALDILCFLALGERGSVYIFLCSLVDEFSGY